MPQLRRAQDADRTMDIPDMLEKTLRYPGRLDLMRIFRDAGFINQTPIQVQGASVRPIDVTASLLSPHWVYEPGEEDLTVMRLVISGEGDGRPTTYTYDLYDEYDPATGVLFMARTTGHTCTAVARLVLDGGYSQKGISPPEFMGRVDGCWDRVEKYLEGRGVRCRCSGPDPQVHARAMAAGPWLPQSNAQVSTTNDRSQTCPGVGI